MQGWSGTHQNCTLGSPVSREDELSLDWSREGATKIKWGGRDSHG